MNLSTKISKYLTLQDTIAYGSKISGNGAKRRGIDNSPNNIELQNIKNLANNIYDPLYDYFGRYIWIESYYRNTEYNKSINGDKNSQHKYGQAVDLDDDLGNIKNSEIFYYIANSLEFDQLIWEFGNGVNCGWVHVSYNKGNNRNKFTLCYKFGGKSKYEHFKTLAEFDKRKNEIYN